MPSAADSEKSIRNAREGTTPFQVLVLARRCGIWGAAVQPGAPTPHLPSLALPAHGGTGIAMPMSIGMPREAKIKERRRQATAPPSLKPPALRDRVVRPRSEAITISVTRSKAIAVAECGASRNSATSPRRSLPTRILSTRSCSALRLRMSGSAFWSPHGLAAQYKSTERVGARARYVSSSCLRPSAAGRGGFPTEPPEPRSTDSLPLCQIHPRSDSGDGDLASR